jgi:hypothetical protein
VKIKGTCQRDGREFLVDQVIDYGGHCPWDGKPFQPDYTGPLAEALLQAQAAGSALEEALEKVAGMDPAFALHEDSILGRIRPYLEDLRAGRKPRVPLPRT